MNIRMIGTNSIKKLLHEKDFYSHLNKEDILRQITHKQKEFVKILK